MKRGKKESKNKKGVVIQPFLLALIMAVIAIALVLMIYVVLKDKGVNALDYIKNLFSFRGWDGAQ